MPDVPYNEPAQLRAGDTASWLKTVDDYPPSGGWSLKYAFRNANSKFSVTATTSGTDYLAAITRAVSKTYIPGRYDWTAYVIKGTPPSDEQHTVATGSVTVLPDLSADVVYDGRSMARQIYDDLIAAYKAFIMSNGMMSDFSVAGKSVTYKSAADIILQIKHWERIVRDEEAAEAVAKGFKNPRQVGVRLTRI